MTKRLLACALAAFSLLALAGAALAQSDDYLRGYVTALLEQRFGITGMDVPVTEGVLRLDPGVFPEAERYDVISALSAVEGLRLELLGPPAQAVVPPPVGEPPVLMVSNALGWLPRENLFGELIADPRWPRFSTSLQFYGGETELNTVFAANLGATIPVYGWTALGGQWQLGVQGGVFSIFDLDSESFDLINADYLFGLPLSARYGAFSAMVRFAHQSSHLGDEFVLRADTERINLSYEAINALVSYGMFDALRVYGGGGAIVRSDPDLAAPFVQAGVEVTSPDPLIGNILYPVAAFDFQTAEELDWEQNYSVRAGLELRTPFLEERRLQLLFEYFNGRSPNGQFFEEELETLGVGLHFFF